MACVHTAGNTIDSRPKDSAFAVSVSRHIDKSGAALHFVELGGNGNPAVRHNRGVLVATLAGYDNHLAILVGDRHLVVR